MSPIYINLFTFSCISTQLILRTLETHSSQSLLRVWSDLVLGSIKSCGRPKTTLKRYITLHPFLCKAIIVVIGYACTWTKPVYLFNFLDRHSLLISKSKDICRKGVQIYHTSNIFNESCILNCCKLFLWKLQCMAFRLL